MRNAEIKSKAIQIWIILSLFWIWSFKNLAHAETEFVKYSDFKDKDRMEYVKYSDPKKSIKGDGSSDDPYQIAHPAHFEIMRENLWSHFKLVQNLDLGEEENFKPIKKRDNSFTGFFDGGDKIIRNLKIQRPKEDDVGLFGRITGSSVIQNVRLENIDIEGKKFVGGIVGKNSGTIKNSYAMGKVVGKSSSVGGLVGLNDGTIQTSYATGEVNGDYNVGGLVGYNGAVDGSGIDIYRDRVYAGTIKTSYATVKVVGNEDVGGFVGQNYKGEIRGSYATGEVLGNENVGGFAGQNGSDDTTGAEGSGIYTGTIEGSYAIGKVGGKQNIGGFVGKNDEEGRIESRNYWKAGSAEQGIGWNLGGVSHLESKAEPEIKALILKEIEWTEGDVWVIVLGEHPQLNWIYWQKYPIEGGDGSLDNPYEISHPKHFELVRRHLSSHFKLTKNLDLGEEENFKPMGSQKISFTGTFDGGGKIIKNLKIQRLDESEVGLFGRIGGNSVIRNVRLEAIDIRGKSRVGGLVGLNNEGAMVVGSYAKGKIRGEGDIGGLVGKNNGVIEKSYARVRGLSKSGIGGLVGRNEKEGKIQGSYATGQIKGRNGVGGLVGMNDRGEITESYAMAKVMGKDKVGGLVGMNDRGKIAESYATGRIVGEDGVGGLVGKNAGTIETSYATGRIDGKEDIGGLVGINGEVGSFGIIKFSYATGKAQGEYGIGGFVGWNYKGTIEMSYAMGKIGGNDTVGGFLGWNFKGKMQGINYWNKNSTKQGVGNSWGKISNIESRTEFEIYALIQNAWKNEKMWVFAPQKHPRLRWQSLQ